MIKKLKIDNFKQIMILFWPIALTAILSNTLALVDSVMIANYDIFGVSAIAVTSQIQFLFRPIFFAIAMGTGVYTVQYFSSKKMADVKKIAAIAIILLSTLAIIDFTVLALYGETIINVLSPSDESSYQIINLAYEYLKIYKYSIIFIPLEMFFIYQYRSIKRPKVSLYFGTIQSILNIIFNFLFIYGLFFFPELGIKGAAISTVLSRIIESLMYVIYSFKIKAPFLGTIQEMFSFDRKLFFDVLKNIAPLMLVELGFGIGNIIYLKIYALSGTDGYTAYNIAKTISFTVNALVMSTASVATILAGTYIATEKTAKEIRQKMVNVFKFIGYNSVILIILGFVILPLFIPFFTHNEDYQVVIKQILAINGIWMAIRVFSSSIIGILKSGNDNRFVLLIDAGMTYIVGVPLTLFAYIIFSPSIVVLRSMIIIEVAAKLLVGYYRYKQEKWINKV